MAGKHILLVDDEKNMLNSMAFILEAAAYQVSLAEDGQSALNCIADANAAQQPIDLMITDIRMPGMDGLMLLGLLRQKKINIPTIVMTEYGTSDIRKELQKLGCRNCIHKPLNERELLTCIQETLTGSDQK